MQPHKMSPSQALLILLLLAAGVSSKPIVSRDAPRVILPFATKRGTARNGGLNMADAGRERAKALRAQANANANANGRRDDASVDVSNSGVTYVASVGVGSPATQCMYVPTLAVRGRVLCGPLWC